MIELRDLEVRFGQGRDLVRAVRGVSFTVPAGGAFGLVGESGSGKTTVLRVVGGLIEASGGAVLVDGRPVGTRQPRSLRRRVQMVFQDPYGSLHPRHTVDDILREPCRIHRLGGLEARIPELLRAVGLGPEHRFRYPHQLSGGQRQRVAVARALMLEPEVLLLDEPTSALDVSVQAEILNLLMRLRQERNLTFLMVSHNLAVVAYLCERIAIMNNGRILEEARVEDLAGGTLKHPYSLQLLRANQGYDPELARSLVEYD